MNDAKRRPWEFVWLFLLLVFPALAHAGPAGSVSMSMQAKELLDAMSASKSLSGAPKSQGPFVIAVVHDRNVPTSVLAAIKKAFDQNKTVKVRGREFSTPIVAFRDAAELKDRLTKLHAEAVFIPAGSNHSVRIVLSVTRRLKILSSTNVADYVHWRGVTLGLDASGEIIKAMINLASCRDEKVEFGKKIMDGAIVFF
ncbi:MAG TPA: hypothetical protein VM425_06995 [Myxococcota bacterium]|nr:hypothetical protein [Myxococcota bacterium]